MKGLPFAAIVLALMIPLSLARAESPAFEFDGDAYFLRGNEDGIREYLTAKENFDDWTTLVSIREFQDIEDPRQFALSMVENAKAEGGPNANGQVLENEETNSYIADFLMFSKTDSGKTFAEWNLWRIQKKADGLECIQYARRFYKITEETADVLNAARERIVPMLTAFEDPDAQN